MEMVRIAVTGHSLTVVDRNDTFVTAFSGRRGVRKKVTAFLKRHRMKADAISQDAFPWLKRNPRRR